MNRALVWLVISPEFTYVEPVLDDGSGPRYSARNLRFVYCRGRKSRAKALALKAWRHNRRRRDTWDPSDNYPCSPFAGMTAKRPRLGPGLDFDCAACKAKGYVT